MRANNLRVLSRHADLGASAKTGVSMHCHTLHSKETLDFIPFYARKIPIISYIWKRECRRFLRREGKPPDFTKGFWSPPLSPEEVYLSELNQIRNLNLEAMVSITDHDCIAANLELNEQKPSQPVPVSLEWTTPFGEAYFHIGVHNLPPENASEITRRLLDYTNRNEPNNKTLHELFEMLHEFPGVLIVLNHPVWDIEMIGNERHLNLLADFIAKHGQWIHALEVNGFRDWAENQLVMEMAKDLGFPLISGGDRHCLHPNTIINLTDSTNFAEFVEEIRIDKYSRIIVKPEYLEPLTYRQIRSISQIVKDYPEFPSGRVKWLERVRFDTGNGLLPLSTHWNGGVPVWLRLALFFLNTVKHPVFLPAFRLANRQTNLIPKNNCFVNRDLLSEV